MAKLAPWVMVLGLLGLSGCAVMEPEEEPQRQSDSRYTMDQDAGPDRDFDLSEVIVPEPRYEPPSRGGNRSPYEVWGETYEVMDSAHGYQETGIASWYGAKFHGHATSNGEIYDMYQLTAAHRSLPLPTYVRVTNLENDKSTIVRVNDRGPFHGDRFIDLSYAAAKMLDFHNDGTARVEVEALATKPEDDTDDGTSQPLVTEDLSNEQPPADSREIEDELRLYVQVGAFGDRAAAERLREQVEQVAAGSVKVYASSDQSLHRVRIGPLDDESEAQETRDRIEENNLGQALVISRPAGAEGSDR